MQIQLLVAYKNSKIMELIQFWHIFLNGFLKFIWLQKILK